MLCQTPFVQFTQNTVGEKSAGAKNHYSDVLTVQCLLIAAGIPVEGGSDGLWGGNTATALAKFQEKWSDDVGQEFGLPKAGKEKLTLLQPDDDWLLRMAAAAQILIPMPAQKDITGLNALHEWFRKKNLKYEPKVEYTGSQSRSFWAVKARPNLAVQLQLATPHLVNAGPVRINCTTYANMMLSVFLFGSLANACYKPAVGNIGAISAEHLSKSRYGFSLIMRETEKDGTKTEVNYFATSDQICEKAADGKLYSMEIGSGPRGGVGHHALLYGDSVYQSYDSVPSAVDSSLGDFMRRTTPCVYLFGQ